MDLREPFVRTPAEVSKLWAKFRAGDVVACPRCAELASMALAVEGASKSYRLVCTRCGLSTPWFEPTVQGESQDLILRFELDPSESDLSDD
jgi:transcription elongation factor Elf1